MSDDYFLATFPFNTHSKCKKTVDNRSDTPQYLESVLLIAVCRQRPFGNEGKSFRRVMMPAKKKAAKKKKH